VLPSTPGAREDVDQRIVRGHTLAKSARVSGASQSSGSLPLNTGHVEQLYLTIRTALRCTAWVLVAYFAFSALEAMAGKTTSIFVQWGMNLVTDLRVVVSVSLAGLAGLWAMLERRERQRTVVRLHQRIKELETRIDPKRSSSTLTTKGTTNPRDRDV
jgi:hypothetical protein